MKPSTRWALLIAVVVAVALALFLWGRRERPAETGVAQPPVAPKPVEAPPAPKAEPVTGSILFDFDRSVLRSAEAVKLDDMIAKAKGAALDHVVAVGHADRIGGNEYNLRLSRLRAEAVQAYLVGKGVDAARIRIDAKGKAQPVTGEACNKMGRENRRNLKLVECLQRDRRVEVELVPAR